MATINFKWKTITTWWPLPSVWSSAPIAELIDTTMKKRTIHEFIDWPVVLNIFPSLDTEVCATSVQTFDKEIKGFETVTMLCISRDLPFAIQRFFDENDISNTVWLSDFRNLWFADAYGVKMIDWPFAWLLTRCVIVINADWKILHIEHVSDITQQPKYSIVLEKLSSIH